MATWREMARQNLITARALRIEDSRSAASRLYYAVYHLVTDRVAHLGPWRKGTDLWLDPPHETVQGLTSPMRGLDKSRQTLCRNALEDLFEARKIADYKPHETIDDVLQKDLFDLAENVFLPLGENV